MKILILGAKGNLGAQLVKVFVKGNEVLGWDKSEIDITDGELNDSLQWNVTLIGIACPITPPGGGSGGGRRGVSEKYRGLGAGRHCPRG